MSSESQSQINSYYSTMSASFEKLSNAYKDAINEYNLETQSIKVSSLNENGDIHVSNIQEPPSGSNVTTNVYLPIRTSEEVKNHQNEQVNPLAASPSLSIVSTTSTAVTFNVTFPVSGQWGMR